VNATEAGDESILNLTRWEIIMAGTKTTKRQYTAT
jgi:hypothetical protein